VTEKKNEFSTLVVAMMEAKMCESDSYKGEEKIQVIPLKIIPF
jgi:hypothetical protein